ncbi:MAG: OmpA family protein [Bacteroidota bacterium]
MSRQFLITFFLACLSLPARPQPSLPFEGKKVHSEAVYFDFGKHDLRPEANAVLQEIKTFITDQKNLQIEITAHTDSIGSHANNLALSQRRSESVKSALLDIGVSENAMTILEFGETKPATSNHTEEGRQANRRATVEIVKYPPMGWIEGLVKDATTRKGLESMVVVRHKEWRDTMYTDTTGYFKRELPIGLVVGVDVYADCHFFGSKMTKSNRKKDPLEFVLDSTITGRKLTLNNLYFVGNQPVLLPRSKPELPKLQKFLSSNPNMKIEIAGHINLPRRPPVDTTTWNYALSLNRAKMVHDYLIEHGIAEERITYNGYGNWEMVYPKAISEVDQAKNRRVELRVLEGGCE